MSVAFASGFHPSFRLFLTQLSSFSSVFLSSALKACEAGACGAGGLPPCVWVVAGGALGSPPTLACRSLARCTIFWSSRIFSRAVTVARSLWIFSVVFVLASGSKGVRPYFSTFSRKVSFFLFTISLLAR